MIFSKASRFIEKKDDILASPADFNLSTSIGSPSVKPQSSVDDDWFMCAKKKNRTALSLFNSRRFSLPVVVVNLSNSLDLPCSAILPLDIPNRGCSTPLKFIASSAESCTHKNFSGLVTSRSLTPRSSTMICKRAAGVTESQVTKKCATQATGSKIQTERSKLRKTQNFIEICQDKNVNRPDETRGGRQRSAKNPSSRIPIPCWRLSHKNRTLSSEFELQDYSSEHAFRRHIVINPFAYNQNRLENNNIQHPRRNIGELPALDAATDINNNYITLPYDDNRLILRARSPRRLENLHATVRDDQWMTNFSYQPPEVISRYNEPFDAPERREYLNVNRNFPVQRSRPEDASNDEQNAIQQNCNTLLTEEKSVEICTSLHNTTFNETDNYSSIQTEPVLDNSEACSSKGLNNSSCRGKFIPEEVALTEHYQFSNLTQPALQENVETKCGQPVDVFKGNVKKPLVNLKTDNKNMIQVVKQSMMQRSKSVDNLTKYHSTKSTFFLLDFDKEKNNVSQTETIPQHLLGCCEEVITKLEDMKNSVDGTLIAVERLRSACKEKMQNQNSLKIRNEHGDCQHMKLSSTAPTAGGNLPTDSEASEFDDFEIISMSEVPIVRVEHRRQCCLKILFNRMRNAVRRWRLRNF